MWYDSYQLYLTHSRRSFFLTMKKENDIKVLYVYVQGASLYDAFLHNKMTRD